MKVNIKNINVNKIHDEFISQSIYPSIVDYTSPNSADFMFIDGTDMDLVQQIIDVHNISPLPTEPTTDERLQMAEDTLMFLLMGGM